MKIMNKLTVLVFILVAGFVSLLFVGSSKNMVVRAENENRHICRNEHDNDGDHWRSEDHDSNDHENGDFNFQGDNNDSRENRDRWCNEHHDDNNQTLTCNIDVNPSFWGGNNFNFNQVYNFSATVTGGVENYLWSISPSAPALSSTTDLTTSWTSPALPNPGVTWTLTLTVSDKEHEHSATCSTTFKDPSDTATPTPAPTNNFTNDGGDGLGCATHDCSGNHPASTNGQVLGASTMAGTGSFEEVLNLGIMIIGGLFTFQGAKGFKKAFKNA